MNRPEQFIPVVAKTEDGRPLTRKKAHDLTEYINEQMAQRDQERAENLKSYRMPWGGELMVFPEEDGPRIIVAFSATILGDEHYLGSVQPLPQVIQHYGGRRLAELNPSLIVGTDPEDIAESIKQMVLDALEHKRLADAQAEATDVRGLDVRTVLSDNDLKDMVDSDEVTSPAGGQPVEREPDMDIDRKVVKYDREDMWNESGTLLHVADGREHDGDPFCNIKLRMSTDKEFARDVYILAGKPRKVASIMAGLTEPVSLERCKTYRPFYERDRHSLNKTHRKYIQEGSHLGSSDGALLYELAYYAKDTIVELGTCRGQGTYILAWGALNGGQVPVVTVDTDETYAQEIEGAIALSVSTSAKVKAFCEPSWDVAKQVKKPVGLLFVDADHSEQSVTKDLRAWKPKMAVDGIIMVKDYFSSRNEDPNWPDYGVSQAVGDELMEDDDWYLVATTENSVVFQRGK